MLRAQLVAVAAMAALTTAMRTAAAGKTVVISGCGGRGVGLGVARQVLAQDASAEVVVMARSLERAASVAAELGARVRALACDVTDHASCAAAAAAVDAMRRERGGGGGGGGDGEPSDLLALVNNAGYAADLPWFPTPWPARAAAETLAVNLYGAEVRDRVVIWRGLQGFVDVFHGKLNDVSHTILKSSSAQRFNRERRVRDNGQPLNRD